MGKMSSTAGPLKVCILGLGGGGFQYETQSILENVKRPLELILVFGGPRGGILRWESPHTVGSIYFLRSPSLRSDKTWQTIFHTLNNFFWAFVVCLVESPDLVIAVSTSQAVPFGLTARILRIPFWFVESAARVTSLTLTAKFICWLRLCEKFYYVWPSLNHCCSRGICASEGFE